METLTNTQRQELDLSTDEWTQHFASAPVYAKKGTITVPARQATEREEIRTILANGTEETVGIAEPGDMIVTNPGGEEHIVKPDKFPDRYDPTDQPGLFLAKGMIRAVTNPTGEAIETMAPWGEMQNGDPDCILASVFDPEQPEFISPDRYIIGREEFLTSYLPTEPAIEQQPA